MNTKILLPLAIAACAGLWIACSDDSSAIKEAPTPPPGAAPPPGATTGTPPPNGGDAGPGDCFAGTPTTHLEIINACTDAQKIAKNPTLSRLLPDGGVPSYK